MLNLTSNKKLSGIKLIVYISFKNQNIYLLKRKNERKYLLINSLYISKNVFHQTAKPHHEIF